MLDALVEGPAIERGRLVERALETCLDRSMDFDRVEAFGTGACSTSWRLLERPRLDAGERVRSVVERFSTASPERFDCSSARNSSFFVFLLRSLIRL